MEPVTVITIICLVLLVGALATQCMQPKYGALPMFLTIIAVLVLVLERLFRHGG